MYVQRKGETFEREKMDGVIIANGIHTHTHTLTFTMDCKNTQNRLCTRECVCSVYAVYYM